MLATLSCVHTNDSSAGTWFPSTPIALLMSYEIQNKLVKLSKNTLHLQEYSWLYPIITNPQSELLKNW